MLYLHHNGENGPKIEIFCHFWPNRGEINVIYLSTCKFINIDIFTIKSRALELSNIHKFSSLRFEIYFLFEFQSLKMLNFDWLKLKIIISAILNAKLSYFCILNYQRVINCTYCRQYILPQWIISSRIEMTTFWVYGC